MANGPENHLTMEQLKWLVDEAPVGPPFDGEQAKAHTLSCPECALQLLRERARRVGLWDLANRMSSERRPECPSETQWPEVAAGLCSTADAEWLVDHAAHCDYCGPLLRAATEDLNPVVSTKERETIRELPSAAPQWQRNLSRTMARMAKPHGVHRTWEQQAPQPSSWTRWSIPLGVAAILIIGVVLWQNSKSSLSQTDHLIAQAYTTGRNTPLRFPDAGYSPIHQQRGPQDSNLDEPQPLLDAKPEIAKHLSSDPGNSGWQQEKARVDLFEGNYSSALSVLENAWTTAPNNPALQFDLAAAYFERAQSTRQASDYQLAADTLVQILKDHSRDPVALFNLAIVHEYSNRKEAASDWERYLSVDSTSDWATEAHRHLDELRRRQSH